MSERTVIECDGLGKMYRLYESRLDSFLDITSIGRAMPWRRPKVESFWALRNISFKLESGARLGVIGRNGAGKTTLLKLITGNMMASEGRIEVRGEVQALLQAGAGFHPEFTGYENVEASLIQNGMLQSEIKAAVEEIAEFTELGDFLGQPFKTYSAGMQARLVFTTATMVRPDILIVDEILGAGDGYFAMKSRTRMKQLVESGASILLVSHAMDQILQFCDESIWLERGRIILRGPTMEVVKAYDEFIHALQDRQLKAANHQRKLGFRDAVEIGHFSDTIILALSLRGPSGARVDFDRVELRSDSIAQEIIRIGDPQDSDQSHSAYVAMNTGIWSDPEAEDSAHFRSLVVNPNNSGSALGETVFRLSLLEFDKPYAFRLHCRMRGEGVLTATVSRNGEAIVIDQLLSFAASGWCDVDIALPIAARTGSNESVDGEAARAIDSAETACEAGAADVSEDRLAVPSTDTAGADAAVATELPGDIAVKPPVRRWQGEGSLIIDDVTVLDDQGRERAVFRVGSPLMVQIRYHAIEGGIFPVVHALAMYRLDGVVVTQNVSDIENIKAAPGESFEASLRYDCVDLANGRYVLSVSLHRELDPQFPEDTIRYDLLDRSFEFEIVGNPPLRTSLIVLPGRWERNALVSSR